MAVREFPVSATRVLHTGFWRLGLNRQALPIRWVVKWMTAIFFYNQWHHSVAKFAPFDNQWNHSFVVFVIPALSLSPLTVCLSVCLYLCLSLSLSLFLCPCLSVCLSLPLCLCLCLSVSVCLSVSLSLSSLPNLPSPSPPPPFIFNFNFYCRPKESYPSWEHCRKGRQKLLGLSGYNCARMQPSR